MTDKTDQAVQNMIQNLEEKYGKTLDEWIAVLEASGEEKVGARIKYLKTQHGFTHGYANLVALKAKDRAEKAADAGPEDPVDALYAGAKAHLRPIYDGILAAVQKFGDDVVESPKRSYVSLRRSKQFAIVQPSTRTRVDVGLVIKGRDPEDRLEPAGSWNSMCTHRVRLDSPEQVDEQLLGWLRDAYDSA